MVSSELVTPAAIAAQVPEDEAYCLLHAAVRFGAAPAVVAEMAGLVLEHLGDEYVAGIKRVALAYHGCHSLPLPVDDCEDDIDTAVLHRCLICLAASQNSPCQQCRNDPRRLKVWKDAAGHELRGYTTERRYREQHARRARRLKQQRRPSDDRISPRTSKPGRVREDPSRAGAGSLHAR